MTTPSEQWKNKKPETKVSECCGAEIHARDSQYKAYYICGRCGKPCTIAIQKPTASPDQPDSERLLTDEEFSDIQMKFCKANKRSFPLGGESRDELLKQTQRDLTTSLKDGEIRELKAEILRILDLPLPESDVMEEIRHYISEAKP